MADTKCEAVCHDVHFHKEYLQMKTVASRP